MTKYGKLMTGFEFIEMAKKIEKLFGIDGIDIVTKMDGWKYWFDSPTYIDILNESELITIELDIGSVYENKIMRIIEKNGFKRMGS